MSLPITLDLGLVPYLSTALLALVVWFSLERPKTANFPLINKKREPFDTAGIDLVRNWLAKNGDQPVNVTADTGPFTILPPKYGQELRDKPELNFATLNYIKFHGGIPGFDAFLQGTKPISAKVVSTYMTRSLATITQPVAEEVIVALEDLYPDSKDWQEIAPGELNMLLTTRATARIFLGEGACRDMNWVKTSCEYTGAIFFAADKLRAWPAILRPIVHWFLPSCIYTRSVLKRAKNIIEPVLDKRRQSIQQLVAQGKPTADFNAAPEWFEQASNGGELEFDPVAAQLFLAVGANHSTADLLTQTMLQLALHPEYIEPLCEEIRATIPRYGWTHNALLKLELMDSVLKESHRLKPTDLYMTLSDGTFFPKSSMLSVSALRMWDSAVFDNAEKFDGYRWLRIRQNDPTKQNYAQLVGVSVDHMGFGYGQHACPGRFFASNVIKAMLSHLLLKYEWKLADPSRPIKHQEWGGTLRVDPQLRLLVRKRAKPVNI
ncbi:cytochrome P450 [Colletotrichum navitas]|uniref:Cytochrome P450 n=1 Tax=Colletotrichum navitas TaxID=681940 RepID=A0AAD8V8F6_9PEZI|nr:cytochrome P450 [Colletotrichum navitas]KAK1595400.1 cytochrome P450 [Colletotrichum navitas]